MFKKIILSSAVLFLFAGLNANAQVTSTDKGELSALFFGDYYWFANHHDTNVEGNNGFWIRRVYLTYDYQISEAFSGRVRLEMEGAGDFATDAGLSIGVKDAWLKYEFGQHEITAGIAPTPTWELVETVWGYRSVAQSPLDLQDIGNSRGLGVSLKGEIGDTQRFGYHFMVANGNGSATELNKGKKFMGALSYDITENIVAQVYGDYEFGANKAFSYTLQGFLAYQSKKLNIGALYAYQWNDATTTTFNIFSLFTNFDITNRLRGYLRVDHTQEPNPWGEEIEYYIFSDQAALTYLTGGVDIALHPQVSLLPNVQAVFYGENPSGVSPDTNMIARLTLFFEL